MFPTPNPVAFVRVAGTPDRRRNTRHPAMQLQSIRKPERAVRSGNGSKRVQVA